MNDISREESVIDMLPTYNSCSSRLRNCHMCRVLWDGLVGCMLDMMGFAVWRSCHSSPFPFVVTLAASLFVFVPPLLQAPYSSVVRRPWLLYLEQKE